MKSCHRPDLIRTIFLKHCLKITLFILDNRLYTDDLRLIIHIILGIQNNVHCLFQTAVIIAVSNGSKIHRRYIKIIYRIHHGNSSFRLISCPVYRTDFVLGRSPGLGRAGKSKCIFIFDSLFCATLRLVRNRIQIVICYLKSLFICNISILQCLAFASNNRTFTVDDNTVRRYINRSS